MLSPRPPLVHERRALKRGIVPRAADAILFSSLVAAGVAAALTLAADAVLSPPGGASPFFRAGATGAGLAFFGTIAIYNLDRLRDLERDGSGWPQRSAFVARHRSQLALLCGAAAALALLLATRLSPPTWILCALVLSLGLLHRRLKRFDGFKIGYVTLAWVAITLGIPALNPQPGQVELIRVGWAAMIYGAAIGANLVATSLSDRASRVLPRSPLRWAAGLAVVGVAIAAIAPDRLAALAWIPLAELAALAAYRRSERYSLGCVDGALLAGGVATLLTAAATVGG